MANEALDNIPGRGVAFPFRLQGGKIGMNDFERQVEQSIRLILETGRGERVMRPAFGAGMESFAFEPVNEVTVALVRQRVREALVRFEARIAQVGVTVEPAGDGAQILVRIDYRLRRSDAMRSLVLPFQTERGGA